jgi:hypothetical protein
VEETRVPGENCISTHCHQHISSLNAVSSSFWNLSNFNIHWLNRHDILIYIDMSYDHGYDDPLDLRKGKMLFSTKKKLCDQMISKNSFSPFTYSSDSLKWAICTLDYFFHDELLLHIAISVVVTSLVVLRWIHTRL